MELANITDLNKLISNKVDKSEFYDLNNKWKTKLNEYNNKNELTPIKNEILNLNTELNLISQNKVEWEALLDI
jgi:hypothetical protein